MRKMVYVGTYSNEGIYLYDFHQGVLTEVGNSERIENPSYLIFDKKNQKLYAVSELATKEQGGFVASFKVKANGLLELLNLKPTLGDHPCHLCIENNDLYVANYSSGSISQLSVLEDRSIGELTEIYQHEGSGPNKERQEMAHVHFVTIDQNKLYAVDLGIDQVVCYERINHQLIRNEELTIHLPVGSGPRHLVMHQSYIYILNELSSSISVYHDQTLIQTISTLPEDFDGFNTAAAIKLHPNKKFLYASNRGHNSIACFRLENGLLTRVYMTHTKGDSPRDFEFDSSGEYMLVGNQQSNTLISFIINVESGHLIDLNNDITVPKPVCIKIIEIEEN